MKVICQRILMTDVLNCSFKEMQLQKIVKWRAGKFSSKSSCPFSMQSVPYHTKEAKDKKIKMPKPLSHKSEFMFLPEADQAHYLAYFTSLLFGKLCFKKHFY